MDFQGYVLVIASVHLSTAGPGSTGSWFWAYRKEFKPNSNERHCNISNNFVRPYEPLTIRNQFFSFFYNLSKGSQIKIFGRRFLSQTWQQTQQTKAPSLNLRCLKSWLNFSKNQIEWSKNGTVRSRLRWCVTQELHGQIYYLSCYKDFGHGWRSTLLYGTTKRIFEDIKTNVDSTVFLGDFRNLMRKIRQTPTAHHSKVKGNKKFLSPHFLHPNRCRKVR